MSLLRFLGSTVRAVALVAGIALGAVATADTFPSRPIQLVTPFAAGSATDLVARVLADKLGAKLGTPIVVVTKPGAGGNLAADVVAKSSPDGYTLLISNPSLATNSFLYSKLPYDVSRDFRGVGLVGESPYVIIVTPDLHVNTLQELIAYAKAHPRTVNYATGGLGTAMHLNCELFARKAGIELQVVPYANVSAITTDFLTNRVQMMCVPIPSAMQFLSPRRAVPLGVTSPGELRDPFQAPSIRQATGLDLQATNWNGVFAPAKTPEPVMQTLGKAMAESLADPDLQAKLRDYGMTVNPILLRDFDAYFRRELDTWGPLIRAAAIKLD